MTMQEGSITSEDNSAEQVAADAAAKLAEGSKEETPDYKALYEAEQARANKAENDKKAMQGARSKTDASDSLLQEILTRVESGEKANAALIKALAADNTENLGEELSGIQSQAANERAQVRFQTQYNSVYQSILEDAQDDEGNVLIDVNTDERLQAFRATVTEGYKRGSIADIVNALPSFHKLLRTIERDNAKAAVAKAKEEADESAKTKLRKAGLGDHDLGAAAAGTGNTAGMTTKEKIRYGLDQADKNKK